MRKRTMFLLMASLCTFGIVGCGATKSTSDDSTSDAEASASVTGTQKVVVVGDDWGPAVTTTIIHFNESIDASSVSADTFSVSENKESFNYAALMDEDFEGDPAEHIIATTERTVLDAYTCDEKGNKTDSSEYVALELSYSPDEGNPFCYDVFTWKNTVCSPYELEVTLNDGQSLKSAGGDDISDIIIDSDIDLSLEGAIYPQLENVDLSGTYSDDKYTLTYGSYVPKEDGNKHPLVIWLHGAGEGGSQNEIAVLGNEVTSLYSDEFQDVMGGAYVLTPQTDTFWLTYNENGDWQDNPGTDSVYLETLKGLIDEYVASNSNIDTNRIYIGGCSNGGYMTMDMIMSYPDYFAAAFPICEAYADSGITDAQITAIKDLPVWFVYAKNDTTVNPEDFEIPTINRLEAIGANVHSSVFDDVHDTTGRFTGEDGEAYQYMGHWSWLYFFNNQCEEDGVNMWTWLAEQSK